MLADLLLILHLLFILFALLGAILLLRWPWLLLLHLPAIVWVVMLELNGWICPLTPLENRFRQAAGEAGYKGGFIDHYLLPLIYPAGLTPEIQQWLGLGALLINLALYGWVARHWHRRGTP
ncbi:DUF2784 domain-containing protein [Aestuariirhabdus litorea]|nr:DUF2784 domain-containing protein [Aestuariirhabdus litorea]